MLRRMSWSAVLATLLLAGAARAEPIVIDFDFTSSTISVLSGGLSVPPDGSITAGSGRLSVDGTGVVTPVAGPLNLKSFALAATLDGGTGSAMLTGSLNATQVGTWNGTLASLGAGSLSAPLFLNVDLFADCQGFLCHTLVDFPISASGNSSIASAVSLMLASLSVSGSAMVSATLTVTLNGTDAVFNLVGNEVSRTFLPEPGAVLQLLAGVGGLALLLRLRRRS